MVFQYAGLPLCSQTPLPHSTAAGLQVAEYMEEMAEDSEENYNKHFSQFIAADLEGAGLEDLYKEVWVSLQILAYPAAAFASAFAFLVFVLVF